MLEFWPTVILIVGTSLVTCSWCWTRPAPDDTGPLAPDNDRRL